MGLNTSKITRSSDIGSYGQLLTWSLPESGTTWKTVTLPSLTGMWYKIEAVVEYNTGYQYQCWCYFTATENFYSLIDIGNAAIKAQIRLSGGDIQLGNSATPLAYAMKVAVRAWGIE